MDYDKKINNMYEQTYETILCNITDFIENEISKGDRLSNINEIQYFIENFVKSQKDIESIDIFDQKTGMFLFSTKNDKIGQREKTIILEKNKISKSKFWIKNTSQKDIYIKIIENSIGDRVGAVVINAKNKNRFLKLKAIKSDIIIHYSIVIILSILLVFITAFVFFFKSFSQDKESNDKTFLQDFVFTLKNYKTTQAKRKISRFLCLLLVVMFLVVGCFYQGTLVKNLNLYIYSVAEMKTKVVAIVTKDVVSRSVLFAQELENLNNLEKYLDKIRKRNKEINYMLITDNVGRVLYESGDAKKAFVTNKKTGQVSLSNKFYNIALPIKKPGDNAVGWLNVGIKKIIQGTNDEK